MIGIIGGSGFYELLENARAQTIETPYGPTSDDVMVGSVGNIDVAFIARHGREHTLAPHAIPYRANAWALKEAGVTSVIGTSAAGSLVLDYRPGDFVVPDQLVDQTWGRESTFVEGPPVRHLSFADPYSQPHRSLAVEACRQAKAEVHDGGTTVVVQGPRFSTRAESQLFINSGFHMVNMTLMPEVALTRELRIDYVNISVITDYHAALRAEGEPVTERLVLEQLARAKEPLRDAVHHLIVAIGGLRAEIK